MIDEPEDERTEGEAEPLTPLQRVQRRTLLQLLSCGGMLLLQMGLLVFTLVVISRGIQGAKDLADNSLPQRLVAMKEATAQAMTTAQSQYAEQRVKMEDQSIFASPSLYRGVFASSLANEQAYALLLGNYQSLVYGIAAKIPGSGAWYDFHKVDLHRQQQRSEQRVKRLQKLITESGTDAPK